MLLHTIKFPVTGIIYFSIACTGINCGPGGVSIQLVKQGQRNEGYVLKCFQLSVKVTETLLVHFMPGSPVDQVLSSEARRPEKLK